MAKSITLDEWNQTKEEFSRSGELNSFDQIELYEFLVCCIKKPFREYKELVENYEGLVSKLTEEGITKENQDEIQNRMLAMIDDYNQIASQIGVEEYSFDFDKIPLYTLHLIFFQAKLKELNEHLDSFFRLKINFGQLNNGEGVKKLMPMTEKGTKLWYH